MLLRKHQKEKNFSALKKGAALSVAHNGLFLYTNNRYFNQ